MNRTDRVYAFSPVGAFHSLFRSVTHTHTYKHCTRSTAKFTCKVQHKSTQTNTHAHVAVSAKHGSEFRLNLKFIYEQYVCTPGHARAPRVGTSVYENVSSNGGAFQRAPGMVGSFPIEAAVTFPFHSAQQFDGLAGCGSALFALLTLQFRHTHTDRGSVPGWIAVSYKVSATRGGWGGYHRPKRRHMKRPPNKCSNYGPVHTERVRRASVFSQCWLSWAQPSSRLQLAVAPHVWRSAFLYHCFCYCCCFGWCCFTLSLRENLTLALWKLLGWKIRYAV